MAISVLHSANPKTRVRQKESSPHTPDCEMGSNRDEWVMKANCRDCDPDALFVRGAAQREAAEICHNCPVILNCRADALDNRVEFGVWGGLTERQRRAILRRNPDIKSWRDYFARGGELNVQ